MKPEERNQSESIPKTIPAEQGYVAMDVARLTERVGLLAERVTMPTEKLARTEDRLRALETDNEGLLNRASSAHRRRATVANLWERVSSATAGIRQEHESQSLTWNDVFEMIPPDLVEEADRLGQTLDVDALAKKMGMPGDSETTEAPEET